ncbi:MAG TPA: bifunctional glycosyltransferase/class I SAM-dependent methyltransferase [Myxococcota bacterium]|nr:bifunctional glycosyltransferase/class I SAM-dependent methyltransferase [Myxococcota bacterium]
MRLLIFVLSYDAERHIERVLEEIPPEFKNASNVQILLIDDASPDDTIGVARAYAMRTGLRNIRLLKNQINQGYGGNQKIGYTYAIRENFDVVVRLHAGDQFTPKVLQLLVEPFEKDLQVGCVLGARFGPRHSPLEGGMPLFKLVGDRILTATQNRLAGVRFSDWHTGYRAYSVRALSRIAFALDTNDFHFDTEILLQLIQSGSKFVEVDIPAHCGSGAWRAHGLRYAKNALKASAKFMLQKHQLFYDVRFHPDVAMSDFEGEPPEPVYRDKLDSLSPHSMVCSAASWVPDGSTVLDVGSASGYVAEELTRRKSCRVTGVDVLPASQVSSRIFRYERIDLEADEERLHALVDSGNFDVILMLDLIEHVAAPERFLLHLSSRPFRSAPKFIFSTGNVGFVVIRLMLLLGHFNYGRKGILDITHKRLFSVHTFRNLLEQTGFVTQREAYFPFPFRALGLSARTSRFLEKVNVLLIRIRPRLFSYQVMLEAIPLTTPQATLEESIRSEFGSRLDSAAPR